MRTIRWLRRGAILVGLGAAGGALLVTARHILETPQPLQSALPGTARIDRKHGGDIYYNVAGDEFADAIVLLHDFYPGASNYDYRHIFPRLAATWRVYAPDWLGFGMSEHPPLAYTGEFYANTLIGFLRDIVGRPAVVLAHGRAANIAARAAADAPELFSRLVLISPHVEAGIDLEPKLSQVIVHAVQRVSLGLVPYAFLSTKPLLRRLAHRRSALTGDGVAREDAVEHLYASAHQFGGQHAQLALMTGELDLPIQNIFPLLQPPVLLLSGDEDPAHPAEMMEDLAVLNSHADLDVLSSAGEAVFEDQPAMFTEALLDWLATAPTRQQPRVEEQHPALYDDASLAAESAPVALEPEPPVPSETMDSDEADDADDADDAVDSGDTVAMPETSESVPAPSDQPASTPARKSASAPAARTPSRITSASVRASASKRDETAVSGEKKPSRATRQTRQSTAPHSKPDASAAKKPGSRATGAKKSADAAPPAQRSPRKQPGSSRNSD
jgi:pimeloyl-ACP methyl ester carboxylesterase